MHGLFFTGTDTGVGKTYVTAAVARLLRRQGHDVFVSKPIATGAEFIEGRWISQDTLALAEAAGTQDFAAITPLTFAQPLAPSVAARLEGKILDLAILTGAVQDNCHQESILLVEGIGGLLCPLTETETVADLVRALGLPLVIVARRGLGTLNHTLMTLEAARTRKLKVAGVIVSETTQAWGPAEKTNVAELRRLGVPVLAVMPHGAAPEVLESVNWLELATKSSA